MTLVRGTTARPHAAPRRTPRWIAGIRFRQWAHFLFLPLAGFDFSLPLSSSLAALFRGVAVSFSVLAFGYLLNAVADRDMDLDARKNPLALDGDRGDHRLALAALLVSAVALAATGPILGVVATAACLLCGWIYSVGPRLKALPGVGTVMNVGNFAPLLFVGVATTPPAGIWLLALAFTALLVQNQLLHEAADADEDDRGSVRTSFLAVGRGGAAFASAACGIGYAATLLATLVVHGHPRWIALAALPFVAWFPLVLTRSGGVPARMAVARVAHRYAAMASGALLFLAQR